MRIFHFEVYNVIAEFHIKKNKNKQELFLKLPYVYCLITVQYYNTTKDLLSLDDYGNIRTHSSGPKFCLVTRSPLYESLSNCLSPF